MSDFEDKLNSLLGDPDRLDKIAAMAKSLMGGESADESADTPPSEGGGGLLDGLDSDPALLGKIAGLLKSGGGKNNDRQALLNAMKPYLSEKRRTKMDKAIRLARLAEIARLAAGEFGGEDGLL